MNWISSDISSDGGGLEEGVNSIAYATSIEVGKRFALGNSGALVPQAQLSWSSISGAEFTDSIGNDVGIGTSGSLVGRIGLAYEFGTSQMPVGNARQFYVVGNILHEFADGNEVTVADVDLGGSNNQTWAEIGLGGSNAWGDNKSIFAEGAYRTTLGGDTASGTGYNLSAGFRMAW